MRALPAVLLTWADIEGGAHAASDLSHGTAMLRVCDGVLPCPRASSFQTFSLHGLLLSLRHCRKFCQAKIPQLYVAAGVVEDVGWLQVLPRTLSKLSRSNSFHP